MGNLARKQELKEYRLIDSNKIDKSKLYIKAIHKNDDGFITIAIKEENFNQWHYTMQELENENIMDYIHQQKADTYSSINSFYIPQRHSENIRRINALYLDIDKHSGAVTKAMINDLVKHLKKKYFNKIIPYPSLILSTGRGLQLIFLLEHLPKQGLKFWQNIENRLTDIMNKKLKYKGFEVDESCTDVTRVLRIAATYNSKSKTYCELIELNENIYRLNDLRKEYFKDVPRFTKAKKITENNIINLSKNRKSIFDLYCIRATDIKNLVEIRKGECKGTRELICFLYRYYICLSRNNLEIAREEMLKLNERFAEPLEYEKVVKATRSAERAYEEYLESKEIAKDSKVFENGNYVLKGYNYSNTKLIKILKISEQEQRLLDTIISKKEKYRRNNEKRTPRNEKGLTKKQQELQDLKVKVLELKEQGLSLRKIAEELKITLGKVQRCIKK